MSIIILTLAIAFLAGVFYLRIRFLANGFKKTQRFVQDSTPLIHSLFDYAERAGVRRVKVLGTIFAENFLFPKPQLKFWLSNTVTKEITTPLKEAIFLLKNKHYAIFELNLAHEIGHQIVGTERQVLQSECGLVYFSCLSDEVLAWRKALEIIRELSGGIEKWEPKVSGKKITLEEVSNFIENVLSAQCRSCEKPVNARTCPRADVVRATRMHIKTILKK